MTKKNKQQLEADPDREVKKILKNIVKKIPGIDTSLGAEACLPKLQEDISKVVDSKHFKDMWLVLYKYDTALDILELLSSFVYSTVHGNTQDYIHKIRAEIIEARSHTRDYILQILLVLPTYELKPIERLILLGRSFGTSERAATLVNRMHAIDAYTTRKQVDPLYETWLESLDVEGQMQALITKEMLISENLRKRLQEKGEDA